MAFEHAFYFLRHGETDWNRERRTQGQLDSQLSEKGHLQAKAAAKILEREPIEAIVASPLSRARHTAEAVAARTGLAIAFDDELKECNLGIHQGEPHGPWLADYWTGDYDPPQGETYAEFRDRVWTAMKRAVSRGPNVLIVAHGGLWIAARDFVTIRPHLMPMPNALPVRVTPGPDIWQQQVLN